MAQLTETGYKLKTQNEYFNEERKLYTDIDSSWNLDPSTPDGLKIAHDAEVFGNLDEALLLAYNSKDPNKARGIDLDAICALTGSRRDQGTPSTVTLTLTGVAGTNIYSGSLFESAFDSSQWITTASVTIATSGAVDVPAKCTVNGATQADANTITRIVTAIGGLQSVTNADVAVAGTNVQTDGELRLERNITVGRPGDNQVDSMLGEIGAVEGVRRFKIYENDTSTTDSNGLPGHSIAPIIDGGDNDDVAMAIYLKKNPGVQLYAAGTSVSVEVTSPKYPMNKKVIKFSRPNYVDMNVAIQIKNDGTLPSGVGDEIKQAIVDYVAGELIPAECGFNIQGFDIGEDVAVTRVYTPVNQVIGKYGNSYIMSLTVNTKTDILPIAFNELSRWATGNIQVTVS